MRSDNNRTKKKLKRRDGGALWSDTQCETFEVEDFRTASSPIDVDHGSKGGSWSSCTHLKNYGLNTAPMLMRFLAYAVRPSSALEIGCGLGTTADFIARFTPRGSMVTCIEPEPMLAEVFDRRSIPHRPTQLALNAFSEEPENFACKQEMSGRRFDLVYSLEVAEHIDPTARDSFIEFVAAATKGVLVFSAARPDQGGTGHLKESSLWKHQWIELFESAGLVLMEETSKLVSQLSWPERAADISPNIIVMRAADATHITHQVLVNNGGALLDRSLIFPGFQSHMVAPSWTRTSGVSPDWRQATAETKKIQKVYEGAIWPELAIISTDKSAC